MSYSKTDGKMKEGHEHTTPNGITWVVMNNEFRMKCPCCAVMRKTFKGNWQCSRCREVRNPEGKVIYVPSMRI